MGEAVRLQTHPGSWCVVQEGRVGSNCMRTDVDRSPAVGIPGLRRAWAGRASARCGLRILLAAFVLAVAVHGGAASAQRTGLGEPGDALRSGAAPATTAPVSGQAVTSPAAAGPAAVSPTVTTPLGSSPQVSGGEAATAEEDAAASAADGVGEVAAEPSAVKGPLSTSAVPEPAVREVEPELYYLENEAGRLVPVPGFQYRDFVELLRLREGMPKLPTAPEAVLERLVMQVDVRPGQVNRDPQTDDMVAGATAADVAEEVAAEAAPDAAAVAPAKPEAGVAEGPGSLRIELTVMQAATGWVGLPLDLSEALFTEPPVHETVAGSEGRFLLDASPDGSGYRGWFQGEPGTRHRVILSGKLPVERAGGTVQLGLDVPRANASQLTVRSAVAEPAIAVEPAGLPPQLSADATGGSQVSLVGLVGPTRIRLSSEQALLEPMTAAPHASSELVVTINGRQAKTEAVIELERLPPGRRTLTLQLPAFAKLETLAAPAALVSMQGSTEAPQVVVSVDPDAAGRAVIELTCESPVEPDGASLEVLGFRITEIPEWRQWGQVSVLVEGAWQLDWNPEGPLRRVDPSLPLRRRGCVAAFAYDAQPASLPLQVRPLRSRVVVEPEYRVRVGATRVELQARLRVAVRGAAISQLRVGLDGWELEDVGPAGLVDSSAIVESGNTIEIPFVQGLSGDAVIEVRAARTVDRDASRVAWTFPRPVADLVGPATVVILPESDIELTPDSEAIDGLVRQVASPASTRASETLPPLLRSEAANGGRPENAAIAYRLDGPTGQFAATRRFLPRRVAASVATRLDVRQTEISVEETLRFDVAYVPLEVVELLVPDAIVATGTLEVRQGDRLLASQPAVDLEIAPAPDDLTDLPEEDPESASSRDDELASDPLLVPSSRTRVMLPVPLLGAGELSVRYRLPATPPPEETTLAEDIPLVMPVGARFGKQSVSLEAARGLSVDVRGDPWKREMAVQGTTLPRSWAASRPQETIRLAIAAEPQSFGETVVDAAWLQSRLLDDQRHDIYRYRVATSVERLDLQLPPGPLGEPADPAGVQVLLDGRPLSDAVRTDGRLVIDLFAGGTVRQYDIEVVVRSDRQSGWQPLLLAAPLFPEGTMERRFYWELQLSADSHLLSTPRGWTAQQEWAWGTIGFLPRAIVSPEMLKSWITPTHELAGDREQTMPHADRRLVFSGVGHPEANQLWVLPTWVLVLVCSGPVLLVGLVLVQWPLVRKPTVVMTLGILATAAAAVFPWRALLVVQAALPGVMLTVLAAGLRIALRSTGTVQTRAETPMIVSQSSTRTALSAYMPESSRGRRVATERSAS
jgi:hypothetical protein